MISVLKRGKILLVIGSLAAKARRSMALDSDSARETVSTVPRCMAMPSTMKVARIYTKRDRKSVSEKEVIRIQVRIDAVGCSSLLTASPRKNECIEESA